MGQPEQQSACSRKCHPSSLISDAAANDAGQYLLPRVLGPRHHVRPEQPQGAAIADIFDGTSNTILIAEAREAVPWTKPASDLLFENDQNPEKMKTTLEVLGGHSKGGFNALFCDGAVRFIRSNVSVVVLRALITRAAGEVVSSDSF